LFLHQTGKRHCHRKSEVKKAAASGEWCVLARDSGGRIKRDHRQRRAFIEANPCPATGSRDYRKPCPGWHVDHVVPLNCCGADVPSNMKWTPASENLAKGAKCPWDPPRSRPPR
jgi:hypothetical protein